MSTSTHPLPVTTRGPQPDRTATSSQLWRIATLVIVVANVLFNALVDRAFTFGVGSIGEVSARYMTPFTPAPYAFAIWGVIYVSFIVFAIVQLLPRYRDIEDLAPLSDGLLIVNVLATLWVVSFKYEQMVLAEIIIVTTLILAIEMARRASRFARARGNRWWTAPFALFHGWIAVAVIANSCATFYSLGYQGAPIGAAAWAIVLMAVATALAWWIGFRLEDPIFASVVCWATAAIAVQNWSLIPAVATSALVASVLNVISVIVTTTLRRRRETAGSA